MLREIKDKLELALKGDITAHFKGRDNLITGNVIDPQETRFSEDGFTFKEMGDKWHFSVSVPDISVVFDKNPWLLKQLAETLELKVSNESLLNFSFALGKKVPALTFSFDMNRLTHAAYNLKLESTIFLCKKRYNYDEASAIINKGSMNEPFKLAYEALAGSKYHPELNFDGSAGHMIQMLLSKTKFLMPKWAAEKGIDVIEDFVHKQKNENGNGGNSHKTYFNKNLKNLLPFINTANIGYALRKNEPLLSNAELLSLTDRVDNILPVISANVSQVSRFFANGLDDDIRHSIKLKKIEDNAKNNVFYNRKITIPNDEAWLISDDIFQLAKFSKQITSEGVKQPSEIPYFNSMLSHLENYFKAEPKKAIYFIENIDQILPNQFKGYFFRQTNDYSEGDLKSRADYHLLTSDNQFVSARPPIDSADINSAKEKAARNALLKFIKHPNTRSDFELEKSLKGFSVGAANKTNAFRKSISSEQGRIFLNESEESNLAKVAMLAREHKCVIKERYFKDTKKNRSTFSLEVLYPEKGSIKVVIDSEKRFNAARDKAYAAVVKIIKDDLLKNTSWENRVSERTEPSLLSI